MMKMKIRKGDRVMVKRGGEEDKGKIGEVIRVIPASNRIVVQGINLRKKHQKQTQSKGKQIPSGIIEFEAPISVSNVMLIDPKDNQPTKVRLERKDGVSIRISKRTGTQIDKSKVEKGDKKTTEKGGKKAAEKPEKKTADKVEKKTADKVEKVVKAKKTADKAEKVVKEKKAVEKTVKKTTKKAVEKVDEVEPGE
jgi:large subunit ribosomal protein L24